MMQTLRRKVYWPIVVLFILQKFLSAEMFWVLGLYLCIYEIVVKKRGLFRIPFREYKILFLFISWGLLLGIVGYLKGNISGIDIVRDVFYYMNPIIFIFLGAKYAEENVKLSYILNAFIVSSAVLSIISYAGIISNITSLASTIYVYRWRRLVGEGHIVSGVALAVVLSKAIPTTERLPKAFNAILNLISLSYFVLTMSRTNILIMAIMYVVLLFRRKDFKRVLLRILEGIVVVAIVLTVSSVVLPDTIFSAFAEKMLSSLNEINASHTWSSDAEIEANWRGYETSRAINQWKNETVVQQIVGTGFGERIDVGIYAYTLLGQTIHGVPATSIAVLHNGYATQLIKLGILGVFSYLWFYIAIIIKGWHHQKTQDTLESRMLVAVGLIFLTQTYFLNGLFKDVVFLPTVILIGYTAYKVERGIDITQTIENKKFNCNNEVIK